MIATFLLIGRSISQPLQPRRGALRGHPPAGEGRPDPKLDDDARVRSWPLHLQYFTANLAAAIVQQLERQRRH